MSATIPDRTNNFGAIRWIAALAVILSHAYVLRGETGLYGTATGLDLGWSAVIVFFTLSGFLICRSAIERSPSRFWTARILRIFPGLLVCTCVTAVALATLSSLPFAQYAADPRTLRFAFGSGTLVSTEYGLPGVFADHLVTQANGSLWTLRYEIVCYGLVFAIVTMARSRPRLLAAALLAAVAVCALGRAALDGSARAPIQVMNVLELFGPFAIGAWFAATRIRPPRALEVAAAVMLAALLSQTPLRIPAAAAAIALATLAVAFAASRPLRAASRLPDYSYGIYIYAYPIQQAVLSATPTLHPLAQALIAAILVLAPAALSWHLVEKPALRLRSQFARLRVPTVGSGRLGRTGLSPVEGER